MNVPPSIREWSIGVDISDLLATLLALAGLFFTMIAVIDLLAPKHELALVTFDLNIGADSVGVSAMVQEVGIYTDKKPYDLISSSWSECSTGTSVVIYVDSNVSYGPFCTSGIFEFAEKLIQAGKLHHSFTVALPPGIHTLRISVSEDGHLLTVSAPISIYVPSIDEVVKCGGLWPCGVNINEAG